MTNQSAPTIVARGCGLPISNTAYFTTRVEETGTPWWEFFHDPVPSVNLEELGLAAQGIRVIPRVIGYDQDGPVFAKDDLGNIIHDMWDYVGSGSYPNLADFVLEVIELGLHRLNPKSTDFKHVSFESQYRLVHPKAVVLNPEKLYKERIQDMIVYPDCLCIDEDEKKMHLEPAQDWLELFGHTCFGLTFQCVEGDAQNDKGREVFRKMPWGAYSAWKSPEGYDPEFAPGWFMTIPIGLFGYWQIYQDNQDDTQSTLNALARLEERVHRVKVIPLEEVA